MNMKKSFLTLLVVFVLIAAMALGITGCGKSSAPAEAAAQTAVADGSVIGEGATEFAFEVTGKDGETKSFLIRTDAETVGEALLENKLIEGEDSAYGLYVKVVDGETADYNVDGHYWAFYVDGEYASTGVDSTEIEEGATYAFVVE